MPAAIPSLYETALGAFLHDIGKFWQRAFGAQSNLDPDVAEMRSLVLPTQQTHIHALWTWQFFHWLEKEGLSLPGTDRDRVRNLAGYHHRPGGGPPEEAWAQYLVTEADQLAAGMDRAQRTDEDDQERTGGWDAFIRTPLTSPFSSVRISSDLGAAEKKYLPLVELAPGHDIYPQPKLDTADFQSRYRGLVEKFKEDFRALCQLTKPWLFMSSLNALCCRYWHAVPSSTKDLPDVSLYDHSRAVAAIASALYQWHQAADDASEQSITDKKTKKFVWIVGDLSGIQTSLFQLQHQQVRGVARILRARSFLMSLITESAALDLLRRLDLTPFSLLQNAGGRFLLLAANTPETCQKVEELRADVEKWMLRRWHGALALNIAMTEPCSGELFSRKRFHEMTALWAAAAAEAKQHPFSTCYKAVLCSDRYSYGACPACGLRPARAASGDDTYCFPCSEERRLGGSLPRLRAIGWSQQPVGNSLANLELWNGLFLHWHTGTVPFEDFEEGFVTSSASDPGLPLALRYTAHYVPRLSAAEQEKLAYQRALSQEGRQTEPGDIKTFEHIALDALEAEQDTLYGEDLLGIIKADVDRLGAIFSMGVQQPCLGLIAGLSRMMDFFFTARLPQILQEVPEFHSTYVVYAGGDDLLLIGPWRQSLKLLHELRQEFQRYVGTPQITISAAMELAHPDEPLNRSVRGAEERLERAKNQGKNRVCAISAEAFAWDEFETQLKHSEDLVEYIRSGCLSRSFVYKMLAFDRDRMACMDGKVDSHAASWRARWGYHVKRNLDTKTPENLELLGFLNSLFGLNQEFVQAIKTPSARTAITVALYRNRKFH